MSNYKKTLVTTLVILILSAMIVPLIKAETLTTDKLTYYLGEDNQAILTGTDFEPGISVTIQVTIAEDLNYNFTSEVIMVGDDGTFTYTYPLPGLEGNYTAAALDEAGTVLATTTFLDPTGYSPSAVTSSDSGGNTKTLFLPSDDVYAKITSTNTGSTTDYNFYIVTAIPANGQSLNDARGSPTSITVESTSQTSLVWSHPTSTGTYYIIIDKGNAGSKDGIDVVSASFTVANLYVFGTDDATQYNDASHIENLGSVTKGTDVDVNIYVTGTQSLFWMLDLAGGYQDDSTLSPILITNPQHDTISSNWDQTTVELTIHTSGLTAGTTYNGKLVATSFPYYAYYYFQFTVEAPTTTTYTVTFTETGYDPSTTAWGVTFDGTHQTSTTNTITFTDVAVGTDYAYSVDKITVSGTEQYDPKPASGTLDVVDDDVEVDITYYHQYDVVFQYHLSDSSTPSSPTVYYTKLGNPATATAALAPSTTSHHWVDAGTAIEYDNPLADSTTDERWQINLAIDIDVSTVTASVDGTTSPTNPLYYHQYKITFGYADQDDSTIEGGHNTPTIQPIGSYFQFGSSKPINPGFDYGETSPGSDFVDAGSGKVSYIDYTAQSYSQRWKLSTSPDSMDVDSSTTLSEDGYFHQYLISATITAGLDSEVTLTDVAVSLTAKQLGSSTTVSFTVNDILTTSHSTYFDSESTLSYSYASIISSTVAGKQYIWATTTGTGSAAGETTRTGSFTFDDYASLSATYTVQYLTTVAYSGVYTGQYSDPVTLTATLTNNYDGSKISGMTITFYLCKNTATYPPAAGDILQQVAGTTSVLGVASASLTLSQSSGSYKVFAVFAGTVLYASSYDSHSFTVTKEDATITYTGDDGFKSPYDSFTPILSAHVDQAADGSLGDITLCTVEFDLFKSTNLGSTPDYKYTVTCDSSGNAVVTSPPNLPADVWTIIVRIDPANLYYTATPVVTVLTISTSTSGSTNGGGWIPDELSPNGKDNFGFSVQYSKKAGTKGSFVFVFRGADDGFTYVVKSNSWQGGGLSFSSQTQASFSGKCVISKVDSTGTIVGSAGNSKFGVAVNDVDQGLPQSTGTDTIAVSFSGSSSTLDPILVSIGTTEIGGGNISVRKT